jgi:hypothetical protein
MEGTRFVVLWAKSPETAISEKLELTLKWFHDSFVVPKERM